MSIQKGRIALLAGALLAATPSASVHAQDFVAAEPTAYDHSTGGGSYDDATLGVDFPFWPFP